MKIYLEGSGFKEFDYIECEVCEAESVDIHHIDARGMGGDPSGSKDVFSNLMAVCRPCHDTYGDVNQFKEHLRQLHYRRFPMVLGYLIKLNFNIEL